MSWLGNQVVELRRAGVAQLIERFLAKEEAPGLSPGTRTIVEIKSIFPPERWIFLSIRVVVLH